MYIVLDRDDFYKENKITVYCTLRLYRTDYIYLFICLFIFVSNFEVGSS